MAKAADQTITWILIAEAVRLVADAYGYSLKRAEADLVRWLGKGRIRWRSELRGRKRDADPGEGSAKVWQKPEGGPHVQLQGPLLESRVRRTVWASRPGRLAVGPGEKVTRPAPLSDCEFVRVEVVREDVIAVLQRAAQHAEAESAEDEPATHAPLKNLGGSPGKWGWSDLAARLPNTVKNNPFEDKAAFEEWCTNNVRRIDGKLRQADPDPRTVRSAISKHQLDQIPGLFKQQ